MERLKEKRYIDSYAIVSVDDFFKKYSKSYKQVVVYDSNLASTINIATMFASLNKGIVAAASDISKYGNNKKITDLRGQWKTNADAYEWALKKLWPKMNHNVIACYHPTDTDHRLRDYLIRHKIFCFWVTDKKTSDNISSSYNLELEFTKKLWASTRDNTAMIGFTEGTGSEKGLTEYFGVGLAGEYGKLMSVCNWSTSLSFYSGISVDIDKIVSKYSKIRRAQTPALDNSKVYVAFAIVESGDSPIYWQAVQRRVWEDPARGQIPIGWSLGPTSFEIFGPIVEYFYDQASANDYFFLAVSGSAYVHPYRNFMSRTSNPEKSWARHLELLQKYIDRLKMHQIALYTDAWTKFDREKNDPVTLRFAELRDIDMLIMGMGRDENALEIGPNYMLGKRNAVVSHVVTRWDTANIGRNDKNNAWLAEEIRKNTPSARPAFIVVHPLSWSYYPSDLVEVLKQLGSDYVAISLPDFCELYKKANQ